MKKEVSEKIKALRFASQLVGRRILAGSFSSMFLGEGYEFHSSRKYSIEDDGRAIDWNVSARMNTPFVKTYKQDRNINIFLCIDFSRSMNSCYNGIMLKDIAKELSYIFSLFSLNNSIPAGCLYFSANSFNIVLPSTSRYCIFNMLERIEKEDFNQGFFTKRNFATDSLSSQGGTPLLEAIQKVEALLSSRSLIFILSDFNVVGYQRTLSSLAFRHDVVAIRLVNDSSFGLKKMGTILFHDYESSFSSIVNTSSNNFSEKQKDDFILELDEWKQFCLSSRLHPLIINSSDDIVKSLSRFFASYKSYNR